MTVWKPSVTVAAVIERDGKFLFVEELIDGRKVINQPAGHLDPGESLAAACAREVLEETAHRFEPTGLIGIYRWYYAPKDVTFLRFCFRGKLLGEENRPLDKEIIRALWLTRDDVKASAAVRSPLVLRCIDDYAAGRNYPLDIFSKEFS